MLRVVLSGMLLATSVVHAQTVDSLHIFRTIPAVRYTTSSAETAAWKLAHAGMPYVSIGPDDLQGLNTALREQRPEAHNHRELPDLTHIGFVFFGKSAHVFCISGDAGLLVDLTARRQVRIQDTLERVKLKAALLALGL